MSKAAELAALIVPDGVVQEPDYQRCDAAIAEGVSISFTGGTAYRTVDRFKHANSSGTLRFLKIAQHQKFCEQLEN